MAEFTFAQDSRSLCNQSKRAYIATEGEFTRRHRLWLDRGGLLHRPWFLMGSAPHPNLPESFPFSSAHIYIKYAGQAGKRLGLPEPDLLYVNENRFQDQTDGLNCHRILSLTPKDRRVILDRVRSRLPFFNPSIMRISGNERDWVFKTVLGDTFKGVGQCKHPSNGIALIAYALLLGVPRIVVAGMSLTEDGHSNPRRTKNHRLHKEEDRASFIHFARHFPAVMTSEPELSELTGIPLFVRAA